MKNVKRYKRGFAMEYAIAVIAIVALFCTLIYLNTIYSVSGTDAYAEYVERKAFLDKIGGLSIDKYDGLETAKSTIDFTEYSGDNNGYGYIIADEPDTGGATVTVTDSATVVLTVTFTLDADSKYKLSSYVYGNIYYV